MDLVKQSSVWIKAPIIKLRPYADKALCVTTALHEYLSRTKDLWKQVDNLFISNARPHLAVTKCTISRWIKSMLETAEIDISIYKSHSTRAAASTAMNENLFPVEDILRTAGWSNVQTFTKFYDKPIDSARTTSDVIFTTTPTNVVPDGLWNLIGSPMQLPCSRIYILGETYLSRSLMYYFARGSTAYGSRCPPWGY